MTEQVPQPLPPARPPIGLIAQVLTCVVFSLIAFAIIFVAQDHPAAVLRGPMPFASQLLFGLGLSALGAIGSYVIFRFTLNTEATRNMIVTYGRYDLSGLKPVWISISSAIGVELLFRAALQPLLGVWIVSIVALLAQMPLHQLRKLKWATLEQAGAVFGCSVAVGFIYQYVGLLAAMLVHTAVNIVSFYVLRNVLAARALASASRPE